MTADGERWEEIRPGAPARRATGTGPEGVSCRVLVGPTLLLVMAAFLGLSHHPRRATAAVAAALVAALVTVSSRRARSFADRVARQMQPVLGEAFGWLLLLPVYALIVTPLGVALRRCGNPPLDLSHDPGRSTYWSGRLPSRATHPRRTFGDRRAWHAVGSSPRQRRQLVLRTLVAVTVAEAVAVGAFIVVRDQGEASPSTMGVATALTKVPASLQGFDWVHDAFAEEGRLTSGMVYTPFTGMSLRDFEGRYFNVKNRVRSSYRSPLAATQRPVQVWFFGGSTTFGFDLQRDQHTIPSEFVRLAEDQGVAIEVRNYGSGGYVNYQETMLLSLLVSGGEVPDLAVFYDGSNDAGLSLYNTFAGLNPRGEPGEAFALTLRHALAESRWIPDATDRPPAPLGLRPGAKPVTVDRTIGDVTGVYGQGVDLSRVLAEAYGFRVAHFWQPDIYSKRPLDDAEARILPGTAVGRSDFETAVGLSERLRHALPSGVIDISDALDHLSGPVLSDNVHTNERGARAVAEAIYRHLRPQLAELSAAS